MRFIHAADLHIDSPLRGLDRYDGAPVERLRTATRSAFERLVDKAFTERVDFMLTEKPNAMSRVSRGEFQP